MSENPNVCPHCTNRDASLIEHLYDFSDNRGWFRKYFCGVCGKGWEVLEITHPKAKQA